MLDRQKQVGRRTWSMTIVLAVVLLGTVWVYRGTQASDQPARIEPEESYSGSPESIGSTRLDDPPVIVTQRGQEQFDDSHSSRGVESSTDRDYDSTTDTLEVRVLDQRVRDNIRARQKGIRALLERMDGEGAFPTEIRRINALSSLSELSVLVILDATGRSILDTDPPTGFTLDAPDGMHEIVSGGTYYAFNQGEFPEFDSLLAARRSLPSLDSGWTAPVEEARARARYALRFRVD